MGADKKDRVTEAGPDLFRERWYSLLEYSTFGIVTYNTDGSIRSSNRAMQEIFSLTDEESALALQNYNILQDPQLDRRGFAQSVRKAFAGEAAILPRKEYAVTTPIEKKPVRVWLEGAIFPIHDGRGKLREVVAIQTDVTELVESLEELRSTMDALAESEERYRLSIESCDAGFVMSEEGKVVLANRKALELAGYQDEPEAFQGKSVFDLVHPDDRERVLDIYRRRSSGEDAPSDYTFKALRRDGQERLAQISSCAVDYKGRSVNVAFLRDITELREAEDALQESEERYGTFMQHFHGIVYRASADEWRPFFFHGDVESITGYTEQEFITGAVGWDKMIHPDDLAVLRGKEELRSSPGFSTEREYRIIRRDGEERWVSESARNIAPGRDQVHCIQGVIVDITARKKAEEALRESEERLREMAENIEEVFWLFDAEKGEVIYASPAYEAVWGRPLQSLYADYRQWGESIHHEDRAAASESFQKALEGKGGKERKYRIVRPDGEVRWISDRAFPIRDGEGKTVRVTGVAVDITDSRREAHERQQLERKIQQTQKMESLGVLAGGIAHDFNNLLMAILGNADLALAQLAPESPGRRFVEEIEKATQRAAELTNQMLAYSGRGAFVMETVRLDRIVREMAHLLKTVISKKAVLQYSFEEGIPSVEADPTQIRQLVMNLITNASEAIVAGSGAIRVSTGAVDVGREELARAHLGEGLPPGRYVFLEVADSGQGMDHEAREKIFDPFYTTKFTGRGLGLAVVQGVVRGHRGAITVKSAPGQGSTLTVLLPASAAEVRDEKTSAEPQVAGSHIRGKTVLLVDDDPNVLKVTEKMLTLGGLEVISAADGKEGLEVFRRRHEEISLVILDMTMPHLSGEETYREMRNINDSVPVILSSGYSEQEAMTHFAGMGLAGFLQKPYRSENLFGKVNEVLNKE